MLNLHRTLVFGAAVLILLLEVKVGYSTAPPVIPTGFVEVTGPHGIIVLVGPLRPSPYGGYVRWVILPDRPPFLISTEPGVTPQDIANTYG
jgi:hypothetical protein